MNARLIVTAFALAAAACARAPETEADSVTMLAAASLTDALSEIAADYQEETGTQVRLSFASSSTLARQIEAGAPADIFAAADRQWMDYLGERGLIDETSRAEPIGNTLVLIAPADSSVATPTVDASLDLPALLGPNGRLAVGDPDHVPAGLYARQALEHLELWDEAEPRLARAEDVRGALALVARGEAPLGIVYATDAAISPDVTVLAVFRAETHEPIVYPFALLGGEPSAAARDFFAYVAGDDGRAVFAAHGFQPR
jgi:molybdate transport system substrate-binding protein